MIEINFDKIIKKVVQHKRKQHDDNRAKKQRKNSDVYPSSLGYCMRKQVMDAGGMSDGTVDAGLQVIFWHGNLIHDEVVFPILAYYFANIYNDDEFHIDVVNEKPFKIVEVVNGTKLYFKGYIDDLIKIFIKIPTFTVSDDSDTSGIGGISKNYDTKLIEEIPIEVKSIGNKFYQLKEPKMTHFVQLMIYLGTHKFKYGYLLYVHKATLKSKMYKVKFDQKVYNSFLHRAKTIYDHKEKGTIPYAESLVESKKYDKEEDIPFYRVLDTLDGDYWFKQEDMCSGCPYLFFCIDNEKEIDAE